MAIYYNRFMESDIEDTVQTPDDVGVDLDQVEENIAGPDGIAAHEDDVDDAVSGVVGDPLDETYMAMYESEYNYNQLLRTIGIFELNEAYYGTEPVLEAGSVKSFFGKVKQIITKLFENIVKAFSNILTELSSRYKLDKKWLEKNEKYVKAAKDSNDKFEVEGYAFPDGNMANITNKFISDLETGLGDVDRNPDKYNVIDDYKNAIFGKFGNNGIVGVKTYLYEKIYGNNEKKKETLKNKNGWITWSINTLKTNEISSLKQAYSDAKKSYNKSLATLNAMEKDYMKAAKAGNLDKGNIASNFAHNNLKCSCIIFNKNVQNSCYSILLKAAKDRRSQARKLAHMFAKQGGAVEQQVQHNSARITGNSVFDKISFI